MARRTLVLVLVLGSGACGGKVELEAAGSGSDGAGGALTPAPCVELEHATLYSGDDDAYAAALAIADGRVALVFWSDDLVGARELRYAEFALDALHVDAWTAIGSSSLITTAGVTPFGGRFAAAWVDQAGAHVGAFSAGAIESAVVVDPNPFLSSATIGTTRSGRIVVAWSGFDPVSAPLVAAGGAHPTELSWPLVVSTVGSASALSMATAPQGAALAWSAGFQSPSHSELYFNLLDEDGAPTHAVAALTDHPTRYVYDVGLAAGPSRLVIGTTDSREDIGAVPLYSTTVALDGEPYSNDRRLTFSGEHENVALAYDGASFGFAYDEFRHATNGSQVYLRQLGEDGADLFGEFQVSRADYKQFGCCTRAQSAKVATDGKGHFLVVWSEDEARPDGDAFSLKAAWLRCALSKN